MASMEQLILKASEVGFVQTECVHEDKDSHSVFDFPRPLGNGTIGAFWRVHINSSSDRRVTHIEGTDTPLQRVSLKNAIDFMGRVTEQYRQNKEN